MKYAVVTGASSGIGRAFARQLSKEGYSLILAARRKERLLALKKELEKKNGQIAEAFPCDLTSQKECFRLYDYCKEKNIDFLINAAGIGRVGYTMEHSPEQELEMLNLNVTAVQLLTKLFLNKIKKGYIINIASLAGCQPGPGMTVYGATKAYLISFGAGINYELKKQRKRQRVITVCPGSVQTEFDFIAGAKNSSWMRKLFQMTPNKCVILTLRELKKGKDFIIPGRMNQLLYFITKIAPRKLVIAAEYQLQMGKR